MTRSILLELPRIKLPSSEDRIQLSCKKHPDRNALAVLLVVQVHIFNSRNRSIAILATALLIFVFPAFAHASLPYSFEITVFARAFPNVDFAVD